MSRGPTFITRNPEAKPSPLPRGARAAGATPFKMLLLTVSAKDAAFLEAYVESGDAFSAATTANYGAEELRDKLQLLISPVVIDELERRSLLANRSAMPTKDDVIREAVAIAFGDRRRLYHEDGRPKQIHEMSRSEAAMLTKYRHSEQWEKAEDGSWQKVGDMTDIDMTDRVKALTLVAKLMGMLDRRITVSGDPSNPITVSVDANSVMQRIEAHAQHFLQLERGVTGPEAAGGALLPRVGEIIEGHPVGDESAD